MSDYDPLVCTDCMGQGETGFDRNESHAQNTYVGYPCDTCDGTGKVAVGKLLEALGGEWRCVAPAGEWTSSGPCKPSRPNDHGVTLRGPCGWFVPAGADDE